MTIKHHPSDETLAAYVGGSLDDASRFVVAAHLSLCAAGRAKVRMLEAAAGLLLEEAEPVPMARGAEAALAKLDETAAEAPEHPPAKPGELDVPAAIEPLLDNVQLGNWRTLGIGLKMRSIDIDSPDDTRLFMLKAEPGIKLPHHRHTGREWTCVLQGAFRHEHGRFGAGDFDEADDTVEHHPRVEEGEPCICIVAMQGGIELQGWLGRLLQPLVRF